MRLILLLIALCFAASAQDYAPLSRGERREFISAANALMLAAEEGNYAGILRFGPGVVKRFESILLDPGSRDLRVLYESVEELICGIKVLEIIDTFEVGIKRLVDAGDYFTALDRYDDFFDYLYTQQRDSLINTYKPVYKMCVEKYFDGSYETYQRLFAKKYIDMAFLKSLRDTVETSFREEFIKISSSNDIRELFEFREQYPGLYESELENLIRSYRMRWRLNVMRGGCVKKIEEYYAIFPERDVLIDSVHQYILFDDFTNNMNIATAMDYLTHFPNGRFSRRVRAYIDVQERQRQMEEEKRLMELYMRTQSAGDFSDD